MNTTPTAHFHSQRRWRGWLSLLGGLTAGAMAALPAHAADPLPAATFAEIVSSSADPNRGVSGKDLYAPESITYNFVRPEDVLSGYAVANGGAAPSLHVSVTALGRGNDEVVSNVQIRYWVRLDGLPYGTPVAMQMFYSAYTTATGEVAQGDGRVTLQGGGRTYFDSVAAGTLPAMPAVDAMDDAFSFDMKAGALYFVDLYGAAYAWKGEASVYVDPVFKFAPGVDTTGLSLSYSAGISPVPEPASAVLFLVGLALCPLLRRQRAGKAAGPAPEARR